MLNMTLFIIGFILMILVVAAYAIPFSIINTNSKWPKYFVVALVIFIFVFGFIKFRDGLLMYAIEHEQPVLAEQVMFIGANVNHANGTPLRYAVQHGQSDIVTILLHSKNIDINAKDYNGNTALMYAIQNKNITQLLIDKGADINAKNNTGETASKRAKIHQQQDIVELLTKYGAKE